MTVDKRRPSAESALVTVGRAITKIRRAHGISQTVLGAQLGLDQTGVSEIERGERPVTIDRLLAIEDALALDRGALVLAAGLVSVSGVEAAILGAQELDENHRELLLEQYRFFATRARAGRRREK